MKIITGLLLLFFVLLSNGWADVPMPGIRMPDKVRRSLEKMSNSLPAGNLATMMQARKAAAQSSIRTLSATPTQIHVPLLVGRYSDSKNRHSNSEFQNQIFDNNPTGTMIEYYRQVSYGQFELSGDTWGWYTVPQKQNFYVGDNSGLEGGGARFTYDLVKAADEEIDYSRYDGDGDGYADVVIIVHTGPGAETMSEGTRNNIWSHRWRLSDAERSYPDMMPESEYVTNDPWPGQPGQFIKVNDYIIQPEEKGGGDTRIIDIGVFCHEFGHALGLPDLYDYDGSSEGIGNWGLMGGGSYGGDGAHPETPVHFCAWSKEFLGWIQPIVTSETQRAVPLLNAEENQQSFYKLPLDIPGSEEYFLIENRQKIGFDQYLFNSGVLIWHVDPKILQRGYSPNNDERHKGVDIEEADGQNDLDSSRNRGDSGDPYPGSTLNDLFNDDSVPNSRDYLGRSSGAAVRIQSVDDQIVTVDFDWSPLLSVAPTERQVSFESGLLQFSVNNLGGGHLHWRAESQTPWLTIVASNSADNGSLTVRYEENQQETLRSGQILVSAEADSSPQILTVHQTGVGEWWCVLEVADKGNETAGLIFGKRNQATAELDQHLGEELLAPRPPNGIFDARFILPDQTTATKTDLRRSGKEPTIWRLLFQAGAGGYPISFRWFPGSLPSGTLLLRDDFTGALISVDMKKESETFVPTSRMQSLSIIYIDETPQTLQLKSGWNQISLPVETDGETVESIFGDAASSAFTFDQGYQIADSLVLGKSYWLKFNAERKHTFIGMRTEMANVTVKTGWNMIGPFDKALAVESIVPSTPDLLASSFCEFKESYVSVETLFPGKGYWIKTHSDGTLQFASSTPSVQSAAVHMPMIQTLHSQKAAREYSLTISDAAGNRRVLQFGLNPQASSGIDAILDEEELPPYPPQGAFDARWIGTSLGGGVWRDLQPGDDSFAGTVHHRLRYQAQQGAITLAWELPNDVIGHLRSVSGNIVDKQMKGVGSLTITLANLAPELLMDVTYSPAAKPQLLLQSPNGGETWRIGEQAEILWQSSLFSGAVTIELSRDNGTSFEHLAQVENSGSWSWNVSAPTGESCFIRLSSQDKSVTDLSDHSFSIQYPVNVKTDDPLPTDFALLPSFPNPFNSMTNIRFQLPVSSRVQMTIFNSRGVKVRSFESAEFPQGTHQLVWNGCDDLGSETASGLYFCRMTAGEYSGQIRLLLLK